jgi:DNA-directed RNA polymerase subunit RPC12/RpoP
MSFHIEVDASGLGFDPEKETAPLNCPKCDAPLGVTFAQIQRKESVACKSCGTNVKLKDEGHSTAKAVADINRGFDDLRRALEDLGR